METTTKNVIILSWPSGVGKSTIARHLARKYDGIVLRPSDFTRELLQSLKIPSTRGNLATTMQALRKIFWNEIYINALVSNIENSSTPYIFIDGIRKVHLIEALKSRYSTSVIYIDSPKGVRYTRLQNRIEKANELNMSFEEFEKENLLESESELLEIKNIADYNIENNEEFTSFINQIEIITSSLFHKFTP